MTEKEIEAHFVRRVKALGGYAYKFRSIDHRGVADRIACMPNGEAWFVELKKPGGRLSLVYYFSLDGDADRDFQAQITPLVTPTKVTTKALDCSSVPRP